MNETILQFGAGRFLRGFVDRFVHEANEEGQNIGRIVVVQSTPGKRAELLNAHPEGYPVVNRGYEAGNVIDQESRVSSITRALVAANEWDKVLEVARSPELRFLVSNATEAGYVLNDDEVKPGEGTPTELPAKFADLLWNRFQAGAAPLVCLPCELIPDNATRLRELVLTQAQRWNLSDDFQKWVTEECQWLNNLVDCIISDLPADDPRVVANPLAIQIEPYALFAIQKPEGREVDFLNHKAVKIVDDLDPYFLRKVRILNGLHTAMVAKFLGSHLETVQEVMKDSEAWGWVRDLLYEEIVPSLASHTKGVAEFAEETLDRFRNPFLSHRLSVIRLNHEHKVPVRLQPTHDEYVRLYGRIPIRLAEAIQRELPKE
ncbi:MAG: altronate dehydrogenase [Gemmataceae bacterium]